MLSRRVLAVVAALGAVSCAASPAERAAERGDWPALGAAIASGERSATLSNAQAASLARVVAEREVRASSGEEGIARVREARSCERELDVALAARTQTHDDAGAEAALVRIDAGRLSGEDARAYANDESASWREVAARGLVRPQDRDARLRALVDPDPAVRREAARAWRDAPGTAEDVGALAEAARLDPEPLVRTDAVRALATLAPSSAVTDALRDLWPGADEALRQDIVVAWAGPLWGSGGRGAVRTVLGSEAGSVGVEAATAVLRRRDAASDGAMAAEARACLTRAIDDGPRTVRLHAIARAPLAQEILAAVRTASKDPDPAVRVGALARLLEGGEPHAREDLEGLARPGTPSAAAARAALARAGDRRVQAWAEGDLTAEPPDRRLAAAQDLVAMGVGARAAPLLADASPSVRVRAACTILMGARGR